MGWETATNGEMEQHLMFHKALIEDSVEAGKIDRYLRILENDAGEIMIDPVDESIRTVFRMVLDHDLDPWSIDLSEFVRVYAERISNGNVDIIVAGKLVHMAWKVLRMQSDATLEGSERYDDVLDWGFDFDPELFDETEGMYIPSIALHQAIHRSPTRPVTMIELLDAFEEARNEIAIQQDRERARLELKAKEPKKFSNLSHDDDSEKDVDAVWSRIERLGTGALSISDLYTESIRENVRTFLAVLVLVRDGKLAIWQDELPYGEIFVEIKMDWMSGIVEDEPQQVIKGVL